MGFPDSHNQDKNAKRKKSCRDRLKIQAQTNKKQCKLFYNKNMDRLAIKRTKLNNTRGLWQTVSLNYDSSIKNNQKGNDQGFTIQTITAREERYPKNSPRKKKENFPILFHNLDLQPNQFNYVIKSERYEPLSSLNIFNADLRFKKTRTGASIKRKLKFEIKQQQPSQQTGVVEFNNEIISKTFRLIQNKRNKKCLTSFDDDQLITIMGFKAPKKEVVDHFKLKSIVQVKQRIKKSVTQNNFYT